MCRSCPGNGAPAPAVIPRGRMTLDRICTANSDKLIEDNHPRFPAVCDWPDRQDEFMDEVEATVLDALKAKAGPRAPLTLTDDLARLSIDSLAMAELALE